jgi:hypothetical protein
MINRILIKIKIKIKKFLNYKSLFHSIIHHHLLHLNLKIIRKKLLNS